MMNPTETNPSEPPSPPAPLYYARPAPGQAAARWWLVLKLFGVVAFLGLVISTLLPGFNRKPFPPQPQLVCANHMRQIGQNLYLYFIEHGRYPDELGDLIETEGLVPQVFICPASGDTPAKGATPRAVAKNLSAGGHTSYIYVGNGQNAPFARDAVVVYEQPGNHRGGIHILFGDGGVCFVSTAQAQQILQQVNAGINPPTKWPAGFRY